MRGIKIYVEGGDVESKAAKGSLRQGLDVLLATQKQAARQRRLHWDVVFCGSGGAACAAFINALEGEDGRVLVLLVDSETKISKEGENETTNAQARLEHLWRKGWSKLPTTHSRNVHLMVQSMETWICADSEALQKHYGKALRPGALSRRQDLEEEPKEQILKGLMAATGGKYNKIVDASKLLGKLRPGVVAHRCSRFATFTRWLDEVIPSL